MSPMLLRQRIRNRKGRDVSAKKVSSDAKDDKGEKPEIPEDEAAVTPEGEGSDPVMEAASEDVAPAESEDTEVVMGEPVDPEAAVVAEAEQDLGPDVHLEAVEHNPRPEGMVIGAAAAGSAAEEPEPAAAAVTPPPAPTPVPEKSGGGFFPALLGGIIAAALGFGLAYLLFGNQGTATSAKLEEIEARQGQQGSAIESLRTEMQAGPDLSALDGKFDTMSADLAAVKDRVEAVAGDMASTGERITALEKRPVTDSVSQEAIAAYEAELERLRQAMQDQRSEVEALIEEARQMESDANATAEATMQRAALTRILSALDTGAPYGAALADLQAAGVDVPEALATSAESGVPSLTDLRAEFPDAARRALSAARASDRDGKSVGDFLRDHLGARSLEPRAGDDPDAVLSRAEDALRNGRLGDALAELETLPDPARAELAGWIEKAETRRNAVAAAEELNAGLSDS